MKNFSWLQVATHALTLVIGLGIGYFTWNNSSPDVLTPKGAVVLPASPKEEIKEPIAVNVNEKPEKTPEPEVEPEPEKPVEPIETVEPKPISRKGLPRTKMGISDKKIGEILSSISENLEAEKLIYDGSLMQDCSGIFHQVKDRLKERLPALAGAEYQYPSSKNVRNTRQIADWYYKNNNLLIVQDALASRNSIRPGSVMFFGDSGKTFKNIDIDMLTDRANNYTSNAAIEHIAVVTAVTTDAEGIVVDYTMMHGRSKGKIAKRTGSKEVQSTRTPNLPPFGHWKQQLVAIANIATPKT